MDRDKLNQELARWNEGDDQALGRIINLAEADLLKRAQRQLRYDTMGIPPADLLSRAYEKTFGMTKRDFDDYEKLLNFLERQMKLIRVDLWRAGRDTERRGAGVDHMSIHEGDIAER